MKENVTGPDSSGLNAEDSEYKYLWLGFPAVVLIWLVYWYWQAAPNSSDTPFDRLNTLFSGLAFWGLIHAILLQKSELILQRRELALTRTEVRGQKEQLEAQNATMRQQRFENTLFSLLDLFTSIVNSMEVHVPRPLAQPTIFKGRECFTLFYDEFQREYQACNKPGLELPDLCISAYDRFAAHRQTHVGHYFRTLYNIIKFIATSEVENKQFYINIVRAQLSSSELNLLFFNCLSTNGIKSFKPYVDQFGLLKNMTPGSLIDERTKKLYEKSAFES